VNEHERRAGHSALRMEDDQMKTFDPNPPIRVTDRRGQRQPDHMDSVAEMLERTSKPTPQKTLDEMITDCFMEPGPGRIVVQPDQFVYKGKMVVPKSAERKGTTGTVLKVGYDCNSTFFFPNEALYRPLRPGDRVAYGMWTGIEFIFDQRPSYRVLMDTEIATVLIGKATELLNVEA
jgi:co-chaperonin GroES (HSP10)